MVNEWEKRLNKTSASLEQVRKDPFPRQFRFDPNTASHEDFSALGFSDIIANRIIKYREMGGEFLTKKDLLKIYNLPDSQFVKLKDFINLPEKLESERVQQKDLTSIKSNESTEPFRFDPNTASHEDFSALGFNDIVANRIIKYREMGGKFLTKKDLLKIYDLPDSQFLKLRDFIDLPDKIETKGVRHKDFATIRSNESTEPLSININQADTTTLKKIKGIGSFYSRQIVKYREILGGYISTTQYEEVYLMTSETVNTLKRDTYISADFQPRTINLNSADFKTLLRHPYISYNLASVILTYRQQHGPFSSVEELKNIHLMDDLTFEQLSPYCTIYK